MRFVSQTPLSETRLTWSRMNETSWGLMLAVTVQRTRSASNSVLTLKFFSCQLKVKLVLISASGISLLRRGRVFV